MPKHYTTSLSQIRLTLRFDHAEDALARLLDELTVQGYEEERLALLEGVKLIVRARDQFNASTVEAGGA